MGFPGAPGTKAWIEAQQRARRRLMWEAVERWVRRFVIGAGVLIALMLVAPYALACEGIEAKDLWTAGFFGGGAGFLLALLALVWFVARSR